VLELLWTVAVALALAEEEVAVATVDVYKLDTAVNMGCSGEDTRVFLLFLESSLVLKSFSSIVLKGLEFFSSDGTGILVIVADLVLFRALPETAFVGDISVLNIT
jgi:hypothetical protein